jgi:hypothetical protein
MVVLRIVPPVGELAEGEDVNFGVTGVVGAVGDVGAVGVAGVLFVPQANPTVRTAIAQADPSKRTDGTLIKNSITEN